MFKVMLCVLFSISAASSQDEDEGEGSPSIELVTGESVSIALGDSVEYNDKRWKVAKYPGELILDEDPCYQLRIQAETVYTSFMSSTISWMLPGWVRVRGEDLSTHPLCILHLSLSDIADADLMTGYILHIEEEGGGDTVVHDIPEDDLTLIE